MVLWVSHTQLLFYIFAAHQQENSTNAVGSRPEIPGVIKDLQPARHSFQKVAFTSWKFNGQNARIRKV